MSTIRERDALTGFHEGAFLSRATRDRRGLLAAGDALAEAATVFQNHHRRIECGSNPPRGAWTHACQTAEEALGTALAAWKAATG